MLFVGKLVHLNVLLSSDSSGQSSESSDSSDDVLLEVRPVVPMYEVSDEHLLDPEVGTEELLEPEVVDSEELL